MAASAVTQGGPERDPALAELRERALGDFRAIAATKAALRSKVRDATDVKSQVRKRPLWVLGLAAGTGLAFAYVLQGRKRIAGRLLAMLAAAAVRRVGGALTPAGAARGASGPTRRLRPAARPGDH